MSIKSSHVSLLLCLLGAPIAQQAHADVRINEVMSANGFTIADEDGDFEDWIELVNTGTETVDLGGWGLSDNENRPFKWVFPPIVIAPGEYLLVWASGKDRDGSGQQGILREVWTGIPGSRITDLINHPRYPGQPSYTEIVTDFFEAPVNIGDNYGQRMSGYLRPPQTGDYTFWIASDDEGQLWIRLDEDDEEDRTRLIARVRDWSSFRQWDKYPEQRSEPVFLREDRLYFIEAIMKEATGGDNLSIRWQMPDGQIEEPIPASRLISSGPKLHANFSISSRGEPLILTKPDGILADSVPPVDLPRDVSYGRRYEEPGVWAYFAEPTPGAANASTAYRGLLDPPVFSLAPGFFQAGSITLEISHPMEDATIFYTMDGSFPVEGVSAYTNALELHARVGEPNGISTIRTTPSEADSRGFGWFAPIGEVAKAHVVRAIAVKDDFLPRAAASGTFFVGENPQERHAIDLVSLIADPRGLFDDETGIYVPGNIYNEAGYGSQWWGRPNANYYQRGRPWERVGHFELFVHGAEESATSGDLGLRIHGGASRTLPQKSIRLYQRGGLQGDALRYRFFEELPDKEFETLILRNSGQDWIPVRDRGNGATMLLDGYLHHLVRHMNFEYQEYRPTVVFLNGEFWGIHNLRERIDKYYFARRFAVDADNLDILSSNMRVGEGSADHYQSLLAYLRDHDIAEPEHYSHVNTLMDVDCYIDYIIAQTFLGNYDWPGNNITYWRARTEHDNTAPAGSDGRWRWVAFDLDDGADFRAVSRDMFTHLKQPGSGWPNPPWSVELINRLWDSPEFVAEFCNRYANHLNTTFHPPRAHAMVDQMSGVIEGEIVEHFRRWGRTTSLSDWRNATGRLKSFATQRPSHVRAHLRDHFQVGSAVEVLFTTSNPDHGAIAVNGMPLDGNVMPGISGRPTEWAGRYFNGLPITVEAVAEPGHRFAGWQEFPDEHSSRIVVTPEQGMTLTAFFEPEPERALIHYWSFNDTLEYLTPAFTMGGGILDIEPGTDSEITTGTGQDFTGENVSQGETVGAHLRVNNPLGSILTFSLPSTGFEEIVLRYETRRSGQGAGIQRVSHTLDGENFAEWTGQVVTYDAAPEVWTFDFGSVPGAADNPDFGIRITFEQGDGGVEGNNRFDNITLDGVALPGVNTPPVVNRNALPDGIPVLRAEGAPMSIALNTLFRDPDSDPLSYSASASLPGIATARIVDGVLEVTGGAPGEADISIEARDGTTPPVSAGFTVLVHPSAHQLSTGRFVFDAWDPASPAMTFPPHMVFLQSERADPLVDTPLTRAYHIPAEDAAEPGDVVQPYNANTRTRLLGLGEEGVAFINTGRPIGRDLGSAIVAINTTGVDAATIGFTTETRLVNSRHYAIRLQYRVGHEGPFLDVTDASGNIVEYERATTAGDVAVFEGIPLPADALGQHYVQVQWRYHYLSGSGSRPLMRLDDIIIDKGRPGPSFTAWRSENFSSSELDDPLVSGPMADPTASGVVNIMRYALGLGRNESPAASMPALTADATILLFPFDLAKSDIRYRVTASPDLKDWSHVIFDSLQAHGLEPVDGILGVSVEPDGPNRFFRLEVEG